VLDLTQKKIEQKIEHKLFAYNVLFCEFI
jgi:hypothetical protein